MKMMIINPCNEVYLVMWLALSSSRSTPLYSMFMHTGSELYVCPTTCASLSSGRQHLVICDLEINTVIMCGSLFILSRRSVFSKLNRFCHSVGTSLGLSHCVDHIRGGLLGRWTPPPPLQFECWLLFGPGSLLSLSEQCFHRRCLTRRALPFAGRSRQVRGQVKWNWQRERSGEKG